MARSKSFAWARSKCFSTYSGRQMKHSLRAMQSTDSGPMKDDFCDVPRTALGRRTVEVRVTENRTTKHIGQYY